MSAAAAADPPAPGTVALAQVPLAGPLGPALELLSEDERERAGRFLVEAPRRRFALARAGLRRLLGRALGADPRALTFEEERHGRPRLAGAFAGALDFNLAHSGELALVAWAPAGPLGVDLELERPIERLEQLAAEVLGAAELATWRALAADARPGAFLVAWTRKEAVLKATGLGLSGGLRELDVRGDGPLEVALPLAARRGSTGNGHAPRFSLQDLAVPAGYRAALAAALPHPRLAWRGP